LPRLEIAGGAPKRKGSKAGTTIQEHVHCLRDTIMNVCSFV